MINVGKTYFDLIAKLPLIRIADDSHLRVANELAVELVLQQNRGQLDPDGQAYFRVLSDLIRDYEKKRFESGQAMTPIDVVKYLMQENGLTQNDMAPLFGGQSCVSLFLSGKRELSKTQIENLAHRFRLSPSIFLQPAGESKRRRATSAALRGKAPVTTGVKGRTGVKQPPTSGAKRSTTGTKHAAAGSLSANSRKGTTTVNKDGASKRAQRKTSSRRKPI